MQTGTPSVATGPSVVILAIAVVLTSIGIGGLATGAADKQSSVNAAVQTSTTTTAVTSPLVTVDASTTTVKVTATTKLSAATTQVAIGGRCKGVTTPKDPGAQKPPVLGTYTYLQCGSGEASDTFKVDAGADPAHRVVTMVASQGTRSETRAYAAGVTSEKFTIATASGTVACDWDPDIVQYPAQLALGTRWQLDSSCEDKNYGVKLHVTGAASVVDRVVTTVGDSTVTAWAINSDITLSISGFGNQMSHIVGTTYYEPMRGLEVYEKATTNGAEPVEKVLKSLTPS